MRARATTSSPSVGSNGSVWAAAAEEHRRELAEMVLDGEVDMAGGRPSHDDSSPATQTAPTDSVEGVPDGAGELRHGQDARPDGRAEHRALAAHSVRCATVVFWT